MPTRSATAPAVAAAWRLALALTVFVGVASVHAQSCSDPTPRTTPHAFTLGVFLDETPSVGTSMRRGIDMALRDINSTGLLGLDTLTVDDATMVVPDVCDAGQATPLAQQLAARNVSAVIGPTCSGAFRAAHAVLGAGDAGVPLISTQASAPDLGNTTAYPFGVLLAPSDNYQAAAITGVVQQFGWAQVAVVGTRQSSGAVGSAQTIAALRAHNVTVSGPAYPNQLFDVGANATAIAAVLQPLKQANVHCIVLFMAVQDVVATMAVAHTLGMYGPGYAYVFSDSSGSADPFASFTSDPVLAVANGALVVQIGATPVSAAASGYEPQRFVVAYQRQYGSDSAPSVLASYAYDATMLVARAIAARKAACAGVVPRGADLVQAMLTLAPWQGATGPIAFKAGANYLSHSRYNLLNLVGLTYNLVGSMTVSTDTDASTDAAVTIDLSPTATLVFPGGGTEPPSIRLYNFALISYFGIPKGSYALPGALLALESLQSTDSWILQGDSLALPQPDYVNDENCVPETALAHFLRFATLPATAPRRPVALIGPYCSADAKLVAPAAATYQMPVITFDATDFSLNNRTAFPYFARTQPSNVIEMAQMLSVVRAFGWQRIAVLGTDDAFSGGGATRLKALASGAGIDVVPVAQWTRGSPLRVIQPIVAPLVRGGVKVYVVYAHADTTALILQALYEAGAYGAGYSVLINPDATSLVFANATIAPVVQGLLAVQRLDRGSPALTAFFARFNARLGVSSAPDGSMDGAYAYDAVFMLAHAIAAVKKQGRAVTDGPTLMSAIRAVDFVGVTGRVYSATGLGADVSQQNDRLGQTSYFVLSNVQQATPTTFTPIGTVNDTHGLVLSQAPVFGGWSSTLAPSCSAGTQSVVVGTQQTCVPCPVGTYSGPNAASCTACPADATCNLGSPLPLATATFAVVPPTPGASPASGASTTPTTTQPPPTGSLTPDSENMALLRAYGFTLLALALIALIGPTVAFKCCRDRVAGPRRQKLKNYLRACDYYFTAQHPLPAGTPLIKRRTVWGGFGTILFVLMAIVVIAYLIHSYFVDRYLMNQTVTPGLADISGGGPDGTYTLDLAVALTLVGMDQPGLCASACASLPALNPSFPGTFRCAVDADAGSATACTVTFTPAAVTTAQPIPDDFTLFFAFPYTRAQHILWSVQSHFSTAPNPEHAYGVQARISPLPGSVLYGSPLTPARLNVLVRPAILENANLLFEDRTPSTVTGYLSYALNSTTTGGTVNATTYYTPAGTTGGGSGSGSGVPGVYVSVVGTRDTSVTRFSVVAKDPQGVGLISSISAFLSGLFGIVSLVLGWAEDAMFDRRAARESLAETSRKFPTAEMTTTNAQLRQGSIGSIPRSAAVSVAAPVAADDDSSGPVAAAAAADAAPPPPPSNQA